MSMNHGAAWLLEKRRGCAKVAKSCEAVHMLEMGLFMDVHALGILMLVQTEEKSYDSEVFTAEGGGEGSDHLVWGLPWRV